MRQYIVENNTNCLEVISVDYTKPLNSTDMKHLLNDLVIAAEHCRLATENSNDKRIRGQLEGSVAKIESAPSLLPIHGRK
jgi:hypothetical protein